MVAPVAIPAGLDHDPAWSITLQEIPRCGLYLPRPPSQKVLRQRRQTHEEARQRFRQDFEKKQTKRHLSPGRLATLLPIHQMSEPDDTQVKYRQQGKNDVAVVNLA